jgi:hypothetical protein
MEAVPLKRPSVSSRPHGFTYHFSYRCEKQILYFLIKYLAKIMTVGSIIPMRHRNKHFPILRKYECRVELEAHHLADVILFCRMCSEGYKAARVQHRVHRPVSVSM